MNNKKYILPLLALSASLMTGCNDDDWSASGPEREHRPMFRCANTTGLDNDIDAYGSKVVNARDIVLYWYTVNDVYGYEIRYRFQQTLDVTWVDNSYKESIIIKGEDEYTYTIPDLLYESTYAFAIRALSNKGLSANPTDDELRANPHNSSWFGIGDGNHQENILNIKTDERPITPQTITKAGRTESSITVKVNLKESSVSQQPNVAKYKYASENYGTRVVDGLYPARYLTFLPSEVDGDEITIDLQNPSATPNVTVDGDILGEGEGTVTLEGLPKNTMYLIRLWIDDETLPECDRFYKALNVRTKGDDVEPYVISMTPDEGDTVAVEDAQRLGAKRIDHILKDFMTNSDYPEGMVFKLEPGGVYFCHETLPISKGFSLECDDPNNRATVYLGIGAGWNNEHTSLAPRSNNLALSRDPVEGESGEITIESVSFANIDFACEKAVSYERLDEFEANGYNASSTATGNYFLNLTSEEAMPFELESFEVHNCTFKNFNRGWFRVKGSSKKVIKRFIVDSCKFSEMGMFKVNGQGYAFISCNETPMSVYCNLFEHLEFTNNLVVDFPGSIIAAHKFTEFEGKWDITFSNNVIVNPSCYKSSAIINFQASTPSEGMTIRVKDNLFVLTVHSENDTRLLTTNGIDCREFTKGITFDISGNYSTARPYTDASAWFTDDQQVDNAYWSTNSLDSKNRGAGSPDAVLLMGSASEAATPVLTKDGKPLYAWDIFEDPRPLADYTDATPADNLMHRFNLDGFKLKAGVPDVLQTCGSPIVR